MAWTRTDIANGALGKLGITDAISDVDTGTDARSKAMRQFIDLAIESLMAECDWPMARRTEELSLVDGTASDPYSDDWVFCYRYNTTWMKFRRVIEDGGGDRNPHDQSKIEFEIISDSSGKLILTDQEDAEAEVIILPEEGYYPAKFVEALECKLAMMAGPRLFGDAKKQVDLAPSYQSALSDAMVSAANEQGYLRKNDPPGIQARRGWGGYRGDGSWTARPNGYDI